MAFNGIEAQNFDQETASNTTRKKNQNVPAKNVCGVCGNIRQRVQPEQVPEGAPGEVCRSCLPRAATPQHVQKRGRALKALRRHCFRMCE
jgi:hypothetical protein